MNKAIIVGASSGIGRELAKEMSNDGIELGIMARRQNKLNELQKELPNQSHIQTMDVSQPADACEKLGTLIEAMDGMDCIVLNAGLGDSKPSFEKTMQIIDINIKGFVALGNYTYDYFANQGGGHIVGVSSVAAHRGARVATVYGASKAFITNWMEGSRAHAQKKKYNINVTDIRPGFVYTDMTKDNKGMFWVASAEKAAEQIYKAIRKKKEVAYITKRWGLIAGLMKAIPRKIAKRL